MALRFLGSLFSISSARQVGNGILGQRQIHPDKGNRTVDTIFPLLGLGFPVRYPSYRMDIANIHRVIPYIHIYLLAVTPGAPSQL